MGRLFDLGCKTLGLISSDEDLAGGLLFNISRFGLTYHILLITKIN